MVPLTFLATMLALTLAAFAAHLLSRQRVCRRLRRLAVDWRMHFVEDDRFRITPRVREKFPVPGASDIFVRDLIYRVEVERYRYLFRVEYTEGVIRTKKRVCRVATFCEARDRAYPDGWSPLVLAPPDLPLEQQYAHLRGLVDGEPDSRASENPPAAERSPSTRQPPDELPAGDVPSPIAETERPILPSPASHSQ